MSSPEQAIAERFEELQRLAEAVQATARGSGGFVHWVDSDLALQWYVSTQDAIGQVYGDNSSYYHALQEHTRALHGGHYSDFKACRGVLRAAADDFASGYNRRFVHLITADLFEDLLEMGEHLLDHGYHIPAATLAGAVLEDTLRKICTRHQVTWQGDSSISKLNTELYKSKVFTKSEFGEIEGWGKLRNEVDHHHFEKPEDVDPGRVERMVEGVRHLIVRYLT